MDDPVISIPASRASRRRLPGLIGGMVLAASAAIGGLSVARANQPLAAGSGGSVLFSANLTHPDGNWVGSLLLQFDVDVHRVCTVFTWVDNDTFPTATIRTFEGKVWEHALHDAGGAPVIQKCYLEPDAASIVHRIRDGESPIMSIATNQHPTGRALGLVVEGPPPPPAGLETEVLESPVRAHDSRAEAGGKLAAGETRTIALPVPPGARAALVTLTVDQTEGSGYLALSAADVPLPPTSNINWTEAGQTLAASATVNIDDQGRINVTNGPNPTHFIIDVAGYLN